MRRPVRTVVGVTAAALVAVACSFTSSGAGGPGAAPDDYDGGLLPDGNIAQTSASSSSGSVPNGSSSGGNPSVNADF